MRGYCVLKKAVPASANTADRSSDRSARLSVAVAPSSTRGRYGKTLFLSLLLLFQCLGALPAFAATPAGTPIDNTAAVTFDRGASTPVVVSSNTVRIISTERRTPSILEFLKLANGSGGEILTVQPTEYSLTGDPAQSFATVPPPVQLGGGTIDLGAVSLVPGGLFHQGEAIFLRLADPDQNRDPAVVDSVLVAVSSSTTGDEEILRLYESGPNTGVFVGYLPTGNGANVSFNGVLAVVEGGDLIARYVDAADGADVSVTAALVDPFGLLFDSRTGLPVSGASVTLIDAASGQPAQVFGDDGVSLFPATVSSGGTVSDSGGKSYSFPPGRYRFPFVFPGTYRLDIVPPAGFAAPSIVSTADLQNLPAAPFAIALGSRGEVFTVNPGPALRIDIPLDPAAAGQLWIQKTAGKDRVSTGDFLPYRLQVQNPDTVGPALGVTVTDRLPAGFRYRKGSVRLDGQVAADPLIAADGRTLTFQLGDLPAGATREIRYVAEVGAGARAGEATNIAFAVSLQGLTSNEARATVRVEEAFFRSTAFLAGQVIVGACSPEAAAETGGLAGARIYLEDGTYVVTDETGRYHIEGLRPGTHVVQLDLDSLPPQYEVLACEPNSRFAGRNYSQFVDLQGGTLWRADFHVGLRPKPRGEATIALNSTLEGETVTYSIPLQVGGVALSNLRLSVMLPEGMEYIPGTSTLGGGPIADPGTGGALTYRLGDYPSGRQTELTLRCRIAGGTAGELPTRAVLVFDAPEVKNQRTPMAENLLLRRIETRRERLPEITLQPHFPTLGIELSATDKAVLDRLAERIRGLDIICIAAIGHTDNVPITSRSQHLFADNFALSEARAKSVIHTIGQALSLAPERISLASLGETTPIADNATEEGRALNRRVEVRVQCEQVSEQTELRLLKDRSGVQRVETVGTRAGEVPKEANSAKPGLAGGDAMPTYDKAWIEKARPGLEWLWPRADFGPAIPSLKVAVKHDPKEKLSLSLAGQEVSPLSYEGTLQNASGTVAVSLWRGIGIKEGDNRFELVVRDAAGEVTGRLEKTIHYSGPPVKVVLASEHSVLVADGKSLPVLAVRLTDRDGFPAREGVVGDFAVDAPYSAREKKESVSREVEEQNNRPQFLVGPNGVALIPLEPTTRTGEVVLRFKLAEHDQEIRAWLKPGTRDWILVGLAEGTAGYNTLSGNLEALPADVEDDLYEDGRLAFFAKGRVKGDWLLTAAYDSDKPDRREESLFQTIDPDTYYTLYGDATQQGYEAPSASKLYLKIERDQFYALFGDYDTGLTVTELSRYSRSLNGLKTELDTGRFALRAFASETAQAFVKDEIRGDGTSGLYRLSRRDLLINSEKVTIEVRDRFRNEIILSSRPLTRHLDYNIDYAAGTLFFKEPITSRDEAFNPIFIVVDYEAADGGDRDYTWGGRGAIRLLDRALEVGGTVVHEGGTGRAGDLYGLDALWKLNASTELRAEVATSDSELAGESRDGTAWLAELAHRGPALTGRLYYREMEEGFGLGQQQGSEEGTRKYGADAAWRLRARLHLEGVLYRQTYLDTDAQRDVAEMAVRYQAERYATRFGLRQATDELGDGTLRRSTQALLGGNVAVTRRLTLRAEHEQALAGNDASRDFPTRTLLGADFRLTAKVTLFAEQEITRGENRDTEGTRAGLKATPWSGGQLHTSLERQTGEYGPRMFALYGLKQTWQVNPRWSLDAGLDRSQTVTRPGDVPLDVDTPPASGEREDFTAVSLGATYRTEKWSWANRLEFRDAETEDKCGLFSGLVGEVREGLGLSARTQIFLTDAATAEKTDGEVRLGLAYRPFASRWIVLDRLDFLFEENRGDDFNFDSWRLVNNLNANYKLNRRTQLSLQYGAKYVRETIDGDDFSGFTDLYGMEGRYDLTERWDVGVRGSALHSWSSGLFDYSSGISVGCNVVENVWVSAGYNFIGFQDEDFSRADFTAQGPFVKFRLKFDQNSVRDLLKQL
jgi:uncharacterized repeat protein (TIGR01451 family)